MILRLKFDHPDDGAAFMIWCEEAGVPAPVDTSDRGDCPYRKGLILEVRPTDPDSFFEVWSPHVMSVGS
jgi:hypothetical protein